jgi:hypothetical protein
MAMVKMKWRRDGSDVEMEGRGYVPIEFIHELGEVLIGHLTRLLGDLHEYNKDSIFSPLSSPLHSSFFPSSYPQS